MNRLPAIPIILAVVLLLPLAAMAAPAGSLTEVKGTVAIVIPGQVPQRAAVGDMVAQGDVVITRAKSQAEIRFEDGSIMRIASNSRVKVTQFEHTKKRTRSLFSLFKGRVQNVVLRSAGYFGRSKENRYEVRTPTAVCGVRGTNFFVSYVDGITQSAVKEGIVYAFSLGAPEEVREVRAGQSMVVVSEEKPPVIRPAIEKDLILEDESEPEGEDLPVTDQAPPVDGKAPDEGEQKVSDGDTIDQFPFTGESFTLFEAELTGFVNGQLIGQIGDFTNSGTFALEGDYTGGGPGSTAMQTVDGLSDDGGAFGGYLGGVAGSWEGLFSGLWVNPTGEAGYLYSFLPGTISGTTLVAEGEAFRSEVLGTVDPESVEDWAPGPFPVPNLAPEVTSMPLGTGTVSDSAITGIETNNGSRWLGVWKKQTSGGTIDTTFQGTSTTFLYGDGDGSYYSLGYLTFSDDGAGHTEVSPYMDIPVTYIDDEFIGAISTWYRGRHDGSGIGYSSVGAGTFTLDRKAYHADWGGVTLYENNSGSFGAAGTDPGIAGGFSSPFDSGSVDFFAMGAFTDTGGGPNYVWNSYLTGNGLDAAGNAEGTIYGFTNGLWRTGGTMSGHTASLYIADDGRAGLMYGSIGGNWFSGVDMWSVSSSLSSPQKEVLSPSYTPQSVGIASSSLYGQFSGDPMGGMTASLEGASELAFLWDGSSPPPTWGIYNFRIGNGAAFARTDSTYTSWEAKLGGTTAPVAGNPAYYLADASGNWNADGEITGSLSGTLQTLTHRGTIGGPVYGQNVSEIVGPMESGTWIASSVGTYDLQKLAWGGNVTQGANGTGLFVKSAAGPTFLADGNINAAIGSFSAPWLASSSSFSALGAFDSVTMPAQTHLFNVFTEGRDDWPAPVSPADERVLQSFIGGYWNTDGTISDADTVALYYSLDGHLTSAGQAGLLYGSGTGNYDDNLGMWEFNGNWTTLATFGFTPGDVSIRESASDFTPFSGDVTLFGAFEGDSDYNMTAPVTAGLSRNLENAGDTVPLGIFSLQLTTGAFTKSDASDVNYAAVIGGRSDFGADWDDTGYWIAFIDDTWTVNGEITGQLDNGMYITRTHGGWIFGGLTGLADPDLATGTWIAQLVGGWQGGLHDFGGEWGGSGESLLYDSYGQINKAGHDIGFFGLVANGGNYDLTAIGDYNDWTGGGYGGAYVWSSSQRGDEVMGYGGAFGFTAGHWTKENVDDDSGDMNGFGIYMVYGEDGTVRLASGDIAGMFHELNDLADQGLWHADGLLTGRNMPTPPEYSSIEAYVGSDSINGNSYLMGMFDGTSEPNIFAGGSNNGGRTKFINYYNETYAQTRNLGFGVYNLKYGDYDNPGMFENKPSGNVPWLANTGGNGGFGPQRTWDEGYWRAFIGSTWYADGTIDGQLSGTYLTRLHRGIINGPFFGTYTDQFWDDDDTTDGSWIGVGIGSYEATLALDFSADLDNMGDVMIEYDPDYLAAPPTGYTGAFFDMGNVDGVVGGVDNGNGTLTVYAQGFYGLNSGFGESDDQGWFTWSEGSDVNVAPGTEGYFSMVTGGVNAENLAFTAAGAAIRSNADGSNIRLYTGSGFTGNDYPMPDGTLDGGYGGYFDLTGTMVSGLGGFSESITSFDKNVGSFGGGPGSITATAIASEQAAAPEGLPPGRWWSTRVIAATGAASGFGTVANTDWTLELEFDTPDSHHFMFANGTNWDQETGQPGPENRFQGEIAATWVSFQHGDTGVGGGKLQGMFDPADASTWVAAAGIIDIDTASYIATIKNGQRAALQEMGVPSWDVGQATMSGSTGNLWVTMTDVTFFATQTANVAPTIWATDQVGGGFEGTPTPGETVAISGGGLNANFVVNNWAAGTGGVWGAEVQSGSGSVTGASNTWNVNFHGGAAGANTDDYNFSGTAAGVVTSASEVVP